MATRRDPRLFMLIVVLIFVINSPDPQPQSYNARSRFAEVINEEWHALGILNTTHYTEFDPGKDKWLNITGLREEDRYAWDLLGPVKEIAKKQTEDLLGNDIDKVMGHSPPLYRNMSGFVQGEWVRSSLGRIRHPSDLNTTTMFLDNPFPLADYDRNLTGAGGSIRLHLSEVEGRARTDPNRTISEITARLIIEDDTTVGKWWEFVLNGVHFTDFGTAILTTTSEKFAGIFGLPHFMVSEHEYTQTQKLLNWTLAETIERQSNRAFPVWNPWTSAPDGSSDLISTSHNCEYIIYLQAHPVKFFPAPDQPPNMNWIEHEMRFPTGFPLPHRSPLAVSIVGFSPDCGFVIESKGPRMYAPEEPHLAGSKTEEYVNRGRRAIVVFAAALTIQLLLLVRQMKETATPSTRNRVSFYTIAMLALGDGFACLSLIFLHLVLNSSAIPLYATAFLALFSVIFQLRFLMDIWTVQAMEQIRQERERGPPTPPNNLEPTTQPPESTASSDTLPLPVTIGPTANTRRPTPPIIIPSDQDDPEPDDDDTPAGGGTPNTPQRAELGALYTRYCLFLLFIFFLTIHSTSMWTVFRTIYFNALCFCYLSFWLPQIYRNIMRNCRKALRWDFVIGQSALRLVPIAYFYAVGDNILFSRTDIESLGVLVLWVWVQILALVSQEVLGPRFFIRESWAPPAYDYHPILREDEENATMPIGPISSPISSSSPDSPSHKSGSGESKTKGKKVFDCSICTQDIEVPVVPSGGTTTDAASSGIGGIFLTRRQYMVTPCRHIFHTQCLEGWMRYRLACPNCREILPPL